MQAAVGRHPDWLGFKKYGGYSRLWNQLAEQLQALPRNRACTASARLRCSPPQTRFAGADAVAGEFESSSGRRIDVDSDSWLAGSVDCVIRHAVDADKHPVAAPTVPIAATDGPITSSTTNSAPSQWHATRPNATGHIEILSSLPNKSVGRACAYPSSIKATTAKHTSIARPTGWPQ